MARVLVVEDNPRLQLLALKVLGARGHEVVLAVDGLEGVSVALATHPAGIVMAVSLPGLGGPERAGAHGIDAADPEPGHALGMGLCGDAPDQRLEVALPAMRLQRHAVPDVGLARRGPDLEAELPYPLGPGRDPAEGDQYV